MKENLARSAIIGEDKKVHLEHLRSHGGYFETFNWMPDEYDNKHEADKQDMIDQKIKETHIHPMPFNAN